MWSVRYLFNCGCVDVDGSGGETCVAMWRYVMVIAVEITVVIVVVVVVGCSGGVTMWLW